MARDTTDPAIKAAALADLASGEQPAVVADRYQLNQATVRSWKARLDLPDATNGATNAAGVATVIQRPAIEAQQLAIGDLVIQNLRAKLIATQRIAEYVTTPHWFDKQTAADVAELFEVIDRSAISVLDRLAAAHQRDDAGDDETE